MRWRAFFILLFILIIIASGYFIQKLNKTDYTTSNIWGGNDGENSKNIISSEAGAPLWPVQFNIRVFNFDVEFGENRAALVKVNAGDEIIMKITFLSKEEVETAKIHPWFYHAVQGVTEVIIKDLPLEINGIKSLQNYEYVFTLVIPENPKDAEYAFWIDMNGCSTEFCGQSPQINFIVGNGKSQSDYGNGTRITTTE